MTATEVSVDEFCRRLPREQAEEVRQHLASGRGCALFGGNDWRGQKSVETYGTRDADHKGYPPGNNGMGDPLIVFVSPPRESRLMVSPLKAALDDQNRVPQIHRPRTAPSQTWYPEVLISGRTSSHPRGAGEFVDMHQRFSPSQRQEPEPPLSEEANWWRDRLGR
jgi:hypothetical protein